MRRLWLLCLGLLLAAPGLAAWPVSLNEAAEQYACRSWTTGNGPAICNQQAIGLPWAIAVPLGMQAASGALAGALLGAAALPGRTARMRQPPSGVVSWAGAAFGGLVALVWVWGTYLSLARGWPGYRSDMEAMAWVLGVLTIAFMASVAWQAKRLRASTAKPGSAR